MPTKIDRDNIYNKYGGHCAYCGEPLEYDKMQIDHVLPKLKYKEMPLAERSRLGFNINSDENLMPSCITCNTTKSSMTLNEFREFISNRLFILNKTDTVYKFAKRYGLIKETPHKIKFYFEKTEELIND
jgi:5-methylcytosine-specific restriction endonuclease McrA